MTIANPGTCRRIGLWPNLGSSGIAGLSATGDCNHSQDIQAAAGIKGALLPAWRSSPRDFEKDQMQLCMEQARLDCLKQAIEQKIVGPQRKDFVKSCVE
jgi:hypothetical protein